MDTVLSRTPLAEFRHQVVARRHSRSRPVCCDDAIVDLMGGRIRVNRATLLIAAGAVCAAGAAEIEVARRFGTDPPLKYGSDVAFGVAWVLAGLASWRLRAGARIAPLMVLLGLLFLINAPWGFGLPTDFPLRTTITAVGVVGYWFQVAMLGHLLLTYPDGQFRSTAERRFTQVGYASAGVISLVHLLVMSPDRRICDGRCGVSPIAVVHDTGLYHAWLMAAQIWVAVLAVAVLTVIVHRYRAASPRRRRRERLALWATTCLLVLGGGSFTTLAILQTDRGVSWGAYLAVYIGLLAVPGAFALGVLRDQLSYASVTDLVRRLHRVAPDDLRNELAAILADPTLDVAYPAGTEGQLVAADGHPIPLDRVAGRSRTLLGPAERPTAVLLHDPDLLDSPELLHAVVAAAGMALDNARLQAEIQAQLVEVRASRARLVSAADEERQRIEQNLHDGAQQHLLGIGMNLQLLRAQLHDEKASQELLDQADKELRTALSELRELAQGIHPAVLTDQGLAAAIGVVARRLPVPVIIDVDVDRRVHPDSVAAAYYIASEALQNAAKHAQASTISVIVAVAGDHIVITVSDDGVGGVTATGGGLRGLHDRAQAAGGTLRVDSPDGRGTTVSARLPCGS